MPRFQNDLMLDAALDWLIANSVARWALSVDATTYGSAVSAKLASVTISSAQFTKANGDVSGRKVTVAVVSAVSVTTQGSATHFALVNPTGSVLTYLVPASVKLLPAASEVTFGAFDIEIGLVTLDAYPHRGAHIIWPDIHQIALPDSDPIVRRITPYRILDKKLAFDLSCHNFLPLCRCY